MDYNVIRALLLFLSFTYTMAFNSSSNISCPDAEREALLRFIRGFDRTGDHFSSWVGKDCCKWDGVGCDDRTGQVVRLDLRDRWIAAAGKFDPSLLRLAHLKYLDLSGNNFARIPIPPSIGSFEKLNYLNLSQSNFSGMVPDQLGNLSRLRTLDLSGNLLTLSNADWLSQLTSLLHVDLSYFLIEKTSNWLQALNVLPSVRDIRLLGCVFGNFPQSLPHVNFTSLSLLDLSSPLLFDVSTHSILNSSLPDWLFRITTLQYLYLSFSTFTGLIPSGIGNMTSLKVLDLSFVHLDSGIPSSLSNLCQLHTLDLSDSTINSELDAFGESFSGCLKNSLQELYLESTSVSGDIPDWIGDLNNLKILDLSYNSLSGSIPASFGKLSTLRELRFSDNKLNGTVPESLGNLNELKSLDLSSNSLVGIVSKHHFSNLTRLESINLNSNSLVLKVSYNWVSPFQLSYVSMVGCKLGPKFPSWLENQNSLIILDLSSTGISDSVPNWFWSSMTHLSSVSLRDNEIHGVIPSFIKFSDDTDLSIDLSSNCFEGPVPRFPSNTALLDLSNNSFSGPIPYDIFQLMPNLSRLFLSMNKINGSIPSSICNSQLISISISNNRLSGELPNCQKHTTSLSTLDLSNNYFSGGIPKWLCDLPRFQSLHLRSNSLSGDLPSSLKTCTNLDILDLGGNMFTGRMPTWLGDLSSLKILSLKANKFVGEIPTELSNLTVLQILDLSNNNLSGSIPTSFGNFTSMRTPLEHVFLNGSFINYYEKMILDIKGREDLYNSILLSQITVLDLSRNSLSGHIPDELTNLHGLLIFDLSSNDLTGQIPTKIGDLMQLEYLNLSRNKLSGAIPSSLSNLSFLGSLDLSYNNLSGRIPTGKQMDTFTDPSMYVGNRYLCGFPLNVRCPGDGGEAEGPTIGQLGHTPPTVDARAGSDVSATADENRKETLLICLIAVAGFAVGFWAVFGVLSVDRRVRIWWLLYIDSLCDSIYVTSRVGFARLKKKLSKINKIDG